MKMPAAEKAGVLDLGTLNGRGARYPGEKARRSGPGFCAVGSRVLPEMRVSDSAGSRCAKAARGAAFLVELRLLHTVL